MLIKKHRFHGYNSLKRAYQHGQTIRGTSINLKYLSRHQNAPYRVSVVVSRKVSKSAVTRNRIRRRLYEAVRVSNNVPAATDLIFTVFSDQIVKMPTEDLKDLTDSLLKRANV